MFSSLMWHVVHQYILPLHLSYLYLSRSPSLSFPFFLEVVIYFPVYVVVPFWGFSLSFLFQPRLSPLQNSGGSFLDPIAFMQLQWPLPSCSSRGRFPEHFAFTQLFLPLPPCSSCGFCLRSPVSLSLVVVGFCGPVQRLFLFLLPVSYFPFYSLLDWSPSSFKKNGMEPACRCSKVQKLHSLSS